MKKTISLSRTLRVGLAILYSAIMILLLILDAYVILNYRQGIYNKWDAENKDFAEELSRTCTDISANLYELYAFDGSYKNLESETGMECLEDVSELNDKLLSHLNNNEMLTGFVYYYDEEQSTRSYRFNSDYSDSMKIEEIKEIVGSLKETLQDGNSWFYVEGEESAFAIFIYEKQNIALAEVIDLNFMSDKYLWQNNLQNRDIFFAYDGQVIGRPVSEKNKAVYDDFAASLPAGTTEVWKNGSYLSARKIGKGGLYLCTSISFGTDTFINIQSVLLLLITVIAIGFSIYLFHNLKKGLIQPLGDLSGQMEKINVGNMEPIESSSNFTELHQITETTNHMVERIHEQERLTYEQTIEGQKARMQYLSLQLKPHFYLNGLKALNAVAMNGDTQKIQDIIMQLSEHLRGKLSVESELVSLDSEIKFAENYVELQRNITDRPISIDWHRQENLEGWYVPNLCIQTFVENSIKYAKLGNVQSELKIFISLNELDTEEGKFLDLYVRDNGAGYSDAVLAIINDEPTEGNACIGINNLKRRCNIIYGGRAEYVFGNDDGAFSNLILPWRSGRENERTDS